MFIKINGNEIVNLDNIDKIQAYWNEESAPKGIVRFLRYSKVIRVIAAIHFEDKEELVEYCNKINGLLKV